LDLLSLRSDGGVRCDAGAGAGAGAGGGAVGLALDRVLGVIKLPFCTFRILPSVNGFLAFMVFS